MRMERIRRRSLSGGTQAGDGHGRRQLVAGDGAVRVDLAHCPVVVLVVGLVAL